ncbi:MAG: ABC transporter ATP-binding protein, partial [Deltaproteobacteria bacterium]|nr:ABC transporter ATP-binding protein [Deltaproteobacteria bacterium]
SGRREIVEMLRQRGITVLLVEQNARAALQIADRAYVLEAGTIVAEGPAPELAADPRIREAYLGR